MNKFSETIEKLIARKNLSEGEAYGSMEAILAGSVPPAQIAAFLVTLRAKGETADEMVGFAKAMRESITVVRADADIVVDTCGTGGDGKGTFNISTASALVVAGAGYCVAKHGNRSISSASGSADVLEALGVRIDLPKESAEKLLREVGIAFLFAPLYHPAMKHAAQVRRELGVRTIFNLLGPLVNPAQANAQVIGVPRKDLVPVMAKVLQKLNIGKKTAGMIIHEEGHDEIVLAGGGIISLVHGGKIKSSRISPKDLGLRKSKPQALKGGNAAENARILIDLLAGKLPDLLEVVAANAGLAIYAAEIIKSAKITKPQAVRIARESIVSGRARMKLDQLISRSKE